MLDLFVDVNLENVISVKRGFTGYPMSTRFARQLLACTGAKRILDEVAWHSFVVWQIYA